MRNYTTVDYHRKKTAQASHNGVSKSNYKHARFKIKHASNIGLCLPCGTDIIGTTRQNQGRTNRRNKFMNNQMMVRSQWSTICCWSHMLQILSSPDTYVVQKQEGLVPCCILNRLLPKPMIYKNLQAILTVYLAASRKKFTHKVNTMVKPYKHPARFCAGFFIVESPFMKLNRSRQTNTHIKFVVDIGSTTTQINCLATDMIQSDVNHRTNSPEQDT